MYSIRCKFCGSNNISKQEVLQSGYSYKKGFLGTLVFGAAGAAAGIGGKQEMVKVYKCEACGKSGEEKDVLMGISSQLAIDDAIMNHDVKKINEYKRLYPNIE